MLGFDPQTLVTEAVKHGLAKLPVPVVKQKRSDTYHRDYMRMKRQNETPVQREARLERQRTYKRARRNR